MSLSNLLTNSIMDTNLGKSISPSGLTPVGFGLDRLAFRIDVGQYRGKILKIAKDNKKLHLKQNQNEIRTWLNVKNTEYEKYFYPIITEESDLNNYTYLIMEEA